MCNINLCLLGVLIPYWNQLIHNVVSVDAINDPSSLIISINPIPAFFVDSQVWPSLVSPHLDWITITQLHQHVLNVNIYISSEELAYIQYII